MQMQLTPVNTALCTPLLVMGVEKRLMLVNILIQFLLLAAGHFHLFVCLASSILFIMLHRLCIQLTRMDPNIAIVFKRATRYLKQTSYPAISSPNARLGWDVISILRPRG